jgi:hypothetical protein
MSTECEIRWLSVRQGAARLGLSQYRMRDLVRRGDVTSLRLPGKYPLVSAEDVERILAECRRPADRREFKPQPRPPQPKPKPKPAAAVAARK